MVVQATNDDVCKLFRQDPERQKFLDSIRRVKGHTSVHDINGGNHGGFGDYDKQIFPCPDGERTISLDAIRRNQYKLQQMLILREAVQMDKNDEVGQLCHKTTIANLIISISNHWSSHTRFFI